MFQPFNGQMIRGINCNTNRKTARIAPLPFIGPTPDTNIRAFRVILVCRMAFIDNGNCFAITEMMNHIARAFLAINKRSWHITVQFSFRGGMLIAENITGGKITYEV
ncbi:MAG: hypothetical protein PHC61_07725 [Chitinivibrionales bacterium]|nr:hypothetical protein [Chitinivibrionales bacterium]